MIQFQVQHYTLKSYNHFDSIKESWVAFNSNPSLCPENLIAIENSEIKDVTPYYVMVFEQGKLVGIIYYQMLHFNSSFIDLGILNKWYYNLLQFFIRRIKTNLLICGSLFRIDFKGFDGISGDEVAMITKTIAEDSLLGKRICGILMKDLELNLGLKTQNLFKFKPMHSDVTMVMSTRDSWNNMDDYLNDLKRKYRKRVQKIMSDGKSLNVKELDLDEIKHYETEITELYHQIVRKQIVRLGVLNGLYFLEMKRQLKDKYKIYGFFHEDQLVAFSTHIHYENSMEIYYIGFSYQQNNTFQLYFNILYHGLSVAIEKGYKSIELGRTAKEAKASMGAEPTANINYYCINNPFLNGLFNKIKKNFTRKMGETWANRQPLK